ncbi:hypothetical protein AX17_005060 [Amanita inopinata Kibby_2008]|nr:hypothetical protein AX17_005060 [Amanita inopinata Kibby_2008]
MSLLVLSAVDVERIVSTFSPSDLQNLMARVFSLVSKSGPSEASPAAHTPHRTSIPTKNHSVLFMPARIAQQGGLQGTTIKVVSVPRSPGDTRGLAASTLVLDEDTGAVRAIVNSRSLTALRNAAGSLLSTTLVGPRHPTSIVAFGAGKQIEAHLDLHLSHFSSIKTCAVVNRTINSRVQNLKNVLESRFPSVSFTWLASKDEQDVKRFVSRASIIICATPSTGPLFPSDWVRAGTHVILIGSYTPAMREVDRLLVFRAVNPSFDLQERRRPKQVLLVDSREACAVEAGELIDAGVNEKEVVEIGELVAHRMTNDGGVDDLDDVVSDTLEEEGAVDVQGPVTMFKSVGLGLQDVAIACAVVAEAEKMSGIVGIRIPKYDVQPASL